MKTKKFKLKIEIELDSASHINNYDDLIPVVETAIMDSINPEYLDLKKTK